MKKALKYSYRFTRICLLAGLAITAAIYAALATNPGLNLIINIAEKLHPELQIQTRTGNILQGLTLGNLNLATKDNEIKIRSLAADVNLPALFRSKLKFNAIAIKDITINKLISTTPKENSGQLNLQRFSIPIKVSVKSFTTTNLTFITPNNTTVINNITANLNLSQNQIDLTNLAIVAPNFNVDAKGLLNFANLQQAKLDLNWNYLTQDKEKISGVGKIDFTNKPDAPIKVDFQTTSAGAKSKLPFALEASSSGTNKDHKITAKISSINKSINLTLDGALTKAGWNGQIAQAQINADNLGSWKLLQPANLSLNQKNITLDPTCFAYADLQLCTHAAIKGLNAKKPKLAAAVELTAPSLKGISALLPQIDNPQGTLDANLKFSGALLQPKYDANMQLQLSQVDIPDLNTTISNLKLILKTTDLNKLTISGAGKIGAGEFKLNGNAAPNTPGFPININLTGTDLELSNTAEIKLTANPNLDFQLKDANANISGTIDIPKASITPRDLSTSVTPSKDVVFTDSKAKKPIKKRFVITTDLKFNIGKEFFFKDKGLSSNIKGNLHVISKSNQQINAQGNLQLLNGKYSTFGSTLTITHGNLLFHGSSILNPSIDLRAEKKVKLSEDDDLAATTDVIVVGAKVTGTLEEPDLSLFSIPSTNESDILAYMLFGKKRADASATEAQVLFQAASSAVRWFNNKGLQQSFGDIVGLDDIGFESVDKDSDDLSVNNLAFGIGKQLTDHLYFHYSIGILEAISSFRLRYDLGRHWHLEANASSNGSGADLTYTLER